MKDWTHTKVGSWSEESLTDNIAVRTDSMGYDLNPNTVTKRTTKCIAKATTWIGPFNPDPQEADPLAIDSYFKHHSRTETALKKA